MIYLLIFGAAIFSFFVSLSGLPNAITSMLSGLNVPPVVVILGLLGAYLVLGCIMDSFAVMVVTIPITSVLVAAMGYDLVWWGILMVCVIETGMLTPPFGLNCMVLKGVSQETSLGDVYRGVMPFVAADIVKLLLLVFVPWLVLWLPSTMLQTSALR
jgi:TRAP-type C4-dicarboxylate transport system permease large subunit